MRSDRPFLSQRRVLAYNRLQSDVMAMTYVVRFQKPTGPLGEQTRRACDIMIRRAHGLYIREPGMPSFSRLFPDEPFTMADLAILVSRLAAAGLMFEERYAHYKAEHLAKAPKRLLAPALDADGFPSKHM